MIISLNGSGISTNLFERSFPDINESVPHNMQEPLIKSPALSHWAVGQLGSFTLQLNTGFLYLHPLCHLVSPLIHHGRTLGTPIDSNDSVNSPSVTNPYSTVSQVI